MSNTCKKRLAFKTLTRLVGNGEVVAWRATNEQVDWRHRRQLQTAHITDI